MSTAMNNHTPVVPQSKPPTKDDQLRRDRITAVVTLAVIVALMALVMWLAQMTGGEVPQDMDTWPLMP